MGIVTISAPFGAGGAEVAPAVAERLGLPFHDRAIPAQVAGRLGVPVAEEEANDDTVVGGLWRLVASLGTMPDPVGGVLPTSSLPDARAYRQQTERVLAEIADSGGGVVLGRAAAMVLGERPAFWANPIRHERDGVLSGESVWTPDHGMLFLRPEGDNTPKVLSASLRTGVVRPAGEPGDGQMVRADAEGRILLTQQGGDGKDGSTWLYDPRQGKVVARVGLC